jgi:hypothetical protein
VILTEIQAINIKWCPFSRVVTYDRNTLTPPYNRCIEAGGEAETNPPNCRCLGSECMAWLWTDTPDKGADRQGCCGLANAGRRV